MRYVSAFAAVTAVLISLSSTANAATDGKNRKVLIDNVSTQVVRELYASPTTAKTWEEDLLGQRTLGPGQSISANIDNGTNECQYDLKVVLANGKAVEHRNVNVCAASKWVIGDSGDVVQ